MKRLQYDARTMRTLTKTLKITALFFVCSCAGLECDADKRASIEHSNRGVELMTKQSSTDAAKEFEQALSLDPQNQLAAYNLGQLYAQQADGKCRQAPGSKECTDLYEKAASAFEQAVKNNDKDAMYVYKLGNSQFEANKLDAARVSLEKALQLNKRLFKAHWFLGKIHEAQGRPKEAAAEYSESARLNPSFGKAFISLGKLYYVWEFLPQAATVLEQGAHTARDPEDRAAINYALGMTYDAQAAGSTAPQPLYDKAIAAYQESLKDDPSSMDTKLQLGFTYADKGDKANGRKFLEEYTKSVGQTNEANAFKLVAANSRLMKLMAVDEPPPSGKP
jgi:tetratricopeptide (TPR) repeat protein